MDRLAESLDQAADALSALAREVPSLDVPLGAFAAWPAGLAVAGADATERRPATAGSGAAEGADLPARLGRALQERWAAAIEARSHEAATAAARVAAMAGSVRTTQRDYTETDEAVRSRFTREM